jgi:limonene-1,2-epoxide hydrolase
MTHTSADPISLIICFNDALNARDVAGMLRLMTEDCIFENTYPAPDGTRYVGQAAVRAFWEGFMRDSTEAHFDIEEIFGVNDRVVLRWIYHWSEPQGNTGHIRGVDVYTVKDDLIAEKLSYVKG